MGKISSLNKQNERLLEQVGELLAHAASALALGDLGLLPLLLGIFGRLGFLAETDKVALVHGIALPEGILADGSVHTGVQFFQAVGTDAFGNVAGELPVVSFVIILLERLHVLADVTTEDVLLVHLGIGSKVRANTLGTREATLVVRNVEATIASTLQGTEDTSTSGGAAKSDIEEGTEGSARLGVSLNVELLTIRLGLSLVVQVELGVDAAGQQQTSAVSGRVVGQTNLQAVLGELVGVSSNHTDIVGHVGRENLASDVSERDADNKAVLGGLVLVLVLDDQTLTGVVVRLALATSLELHLEALEVRSVLYNLDETHLSLTLKLGEVRT